MMQIMVSKGMLMLNSSAWTTSIFFKNLVSLHVPFLVCFLVSSAFLRSSAKSIFKIPKGLQASTLLHVWSTYHFSSALFLLVWIWNVLQSNRKEYSTKKHNWKGDARYSISTKWLLPRYGCWCHLDECLSLSQHVINYGILRQAHCWSRKTKVQQAYIQ